MGQKRNAFRVLVGKRAGKRPLEKPRRRGKDDIKINVKGTEWEGVDWIGLPQDRDKCWAVVNAAMNIWVPYNA
jgi:hypothetical protein